MPIAAGKIILVALLGALSALFQQRAGLSIYVGLGELVKPANRFPTTSMEPGLAEIQHFMNEMKDLLNDDFAATASTASEMPSNDTVIIVNTSTTSREIARPTSPKLSTSGFAMMILRLAFFLLMAFGKQFVLAFLRLDLWLFDFVEDHTLEWVLFHLWTAEGTIDFSLDRLLALFGLMRITVHEKMTERIHEEQLMAIEAKIREIEGELLVKEAKDEQIKGHLTTIEAKDRVIEGQLTVIDAKDEEIKGYLTAIEAKDRDIEGHLTVVKAKDQELEGQSTVIEAKDQEIKGQLTAIEAKDEEIKGQLTAIEAKDDQIKGQITAVEAKDEEIKGQLTTIETKDQEIGTLKTEVSNLNEKAKASQDQLQRLTEENSEKAKQLHRATLDMNLLRTQLNTAMRAVPEGHLRDTGYGPMQAHQPPHFNPAASEFRPLPPPYGPQFPPGPPQFPPQPPYFGPQQPAYFDPQQPPPHQNQPYGGNNLGNIPGRYLGH